MYNYNVSIKKREVLHYIWELKWDEERKKMSEEGRKKLNLTLYFLSNFAL